MSEAKPSASDPVGPTGSLAGARVGLLEGRMGSELANLIRRRGGVPIMAPALREVSLAAGEAVEELMAGLGSGGIDVVVFLTGVGAEAVFAEAHRLGRLTELRESLVRATTVCRGPKPRAALGRREISASVMVREPYTSADVVEALSSLDLANRGVAIVHYGERSTLISEAVAEFGARTLDICVYEWALPEDTTPLERLIDAVVAGGLEAVAFTSQIQVRHLFLVAARVGHALELRAALNTNVTVAAVGPTCAEALRDAGVTPKVVPTNPKMGAMVVALAEYLSTRGPASSAHPP